MHVTITTTTNAANTPTARLLLGPVAVRWYVCCVHCMHVGSVFWSDARTQRIYRSPRCLYNIAAATNTTTTTSNSCSGSIGGTTAASSNCEVEVLVADSMVEGLALDHVTQTLYITDSRRATIEAISINLPSRARAALVSHDLDEPRAITVHYDTGSVLLLLLKCLVLAITALLT